MSWRILAVAAAAAGVAAACGCSGCSEGGTVADARLLDASVPDSRPRHDVRPIPDVFPSAVPDLLPHCRSSRTLIPTPVSRGAGMACGRGCRQVTFGEDVNRYDVRGDLLVYSSGPGIDHDVYLVNLRTDQEWALRLFPPKTNGCRNVATDGRRVTYNCDQDPGGDAFIESFHSYDPATRVESDLTCLYMRVGRASFPYSMTLADAGPVVTMHMSSERGSDAFLFPWGGPRFINISQRAEGVWHTHASGPRVVWTQAMIWKGESGYTQIYVYHTATAAKRAVAPYAAHQYHPRINGDRVVWTDHRNAPGDMWNQSNSDIYVHDLKTGETKAVSTHPAQQDDPDVEGDRVVWMDYRNNSGTMTPSYPSEYGRCDVFLKDLSTGTEVQLTDFDHVDMPPSECRPRIDHGRVFYSAIVPKWGRAVFMIDLNKRRGH